MPIWMIDNAVAVAISPIGAYVSGIAMGVLLTIGVFLIARRASRSG